MTFLQVKYFLTVVQNNSISKAADELYVSRTAVSRTLRELEEEYGMPLLDRGTSGVALTAAGKLVYERFSEISYKYILLEKHMAELRRQLTRKEDREIKLCITPLTVLNLFPGISHMVRERFPDISVITMEADHLQAQDMLADGTLDFQLTSCGNWCAGSKYAQSLVFYQREYVLAMAAGNPLAKKEYVTVEDLRAEPIVVIDQHRVFRSELEMMFCEWGIRPNVVMRTYQLTTLREMVRRGIGCTPMPSGALDDGKEIVSVPIRPQVLWDTALIWNPNAAHNNAFQDFLETAKEYRALLTGKGETA